MLQTEATSEEREEMSQQCVLAAQKPAVSWAASKDAWSEGRGR